MATETATSTAAQTPPQNAQILERLGRRYDAGFVT